MNGRLMGRMLAFIGRLSLLIALSLSGLSCASNYHPSITSTAVSVILNNPEFRQYIHPEARGRAPVIVVSNGLFGNDIDLSQLDYDTKVVESPTGKTSIVFKELKTVEGLIHFELNYDVEGVAYSGTLKVGKASVEFIDYEVSEI